MGDGPLWEWSPRAPRFRLTHAPGQGLVLPVGENERLEGETGLERAPGVPDPGRGRAGHAGPQWPWPSRPRPTLLWASVSPRALPEWKEGWGFCRPHPHPHPHVDSWAQGHPAAVQARAGRGAPPSRQVTGSSAPGGHTPLLTQRRPGEGGGGGGTGEELALRSQVSISRGQRPLLGSCQVPRTKGPGG